MNGGTLLISDIDGTLLGDEAASAQIRPELACRTPRSDYPGLCHRPAF